MIFQTDHDYLSCYTKYICLARTSGLITSTFLGKRNPHSLPFWKGQNVENKTGESYPRCTSELTELDDLSLYVLTISLKKSTALLQTPLMENKWQSRNSQDLSKPQCMQRDPSGN